MTIPTREQLDGLIRARIAEDPAFRESLLADPRAAVGSIIGFDLPDMVTVTVHEESLTSIHLVLPASAAAGELGEADLELVAGGGACWDNCGCSGP